MNHLELALVSRAFTAGRAVRSSTVRHRRLTTRPTVVVLWQLGAEPFTPAAIGWGDDYSKPQMAVAGEPRNRDLAFAALLRFAKWFNPRFEGHAIDRETLTFGERQYTVARTAPQVLVANRATADFLGRIGRRLAYLPTDGARPADPALVRLGRHLRFLWDHHAHPGQQLLVPLTDLMNAHWATAQSAAERESLGALAAFVDPPAGLTGFDASEAAELEPVGPVPDGGDDQRLMPLVEQFNSARQGSTAAETVAPLLAPTIAHFRPMLRRTWELVWNCRRREEELAEAASVGGRWDGDRQAYTRHIDWVAQNGLRRTRQSPRQAAMTLRNLEEAGRLLQAQEACDDPLRMATYVLANKAVRGRVVRVDETHTEPGPKRPVRRPLVVLRSPDPCVIPVGRELWWTGQPGGREFVIDAVREWGGGSEVVLKLATSSAAARLPRAGDVACFSVHSTQPAWLATLPHEEPWTHRAAVPVPPPNPIEDVTGAEGNFNV